MRRTGLNRISDKMKARLPARKKCREIVLARDKVCQFPVMLARWYADAERERGMFVFPNCSHGPLEVHEPAHRRNVDFTDPTQCIASCAVHNQWAESEPALAYAIGWLVRGNGLPLRQRNE